MAFYFVEQPFLAMESTFANHPRFCRQQRSACHHHRQQQQQTQHRRMPRYANSMDQLMEEARRQVSLEQNRTSEAFAMQDFLGVMNGIVDGFLKDQQHHQSDDTMEKNSNLENDESNQDDQVSKKDDSKENAECPKQKCSHPAPLKDYFAAIDAIVNAMSTNQQKIVEKNSNQQSENGTEKNADQSKDDNDTEQKSNNFAEKQQHQPMKDFFNVMDTIVGTLMTHHNGNSISEEKNLRQTEVVDKLSAGGNIDNNVVDQTIKIKSPTAEKDEPKKELASNSIENEVHQDVLKNQVPRSSSTQQVSQVQLMTQVYVDENLDRVQIQIEFSGYNLKPENLDVQVVNNDVLLVKAENDQKQKIFERKFKLPAKCQLDNIQPKFKSGGGDAAVENSEQEDDITTQTLNILVPKVDVKKTVNIPINTTSTTTTQE
jgi:HSP20 family molecular chaperone IbpA